MSTRILAAVVFVATCAAFLPALDGRWLEWDDRELLLDTQRWRGLSFDNLSWMFTTFHMGPYQPLSWTSYALDHEMWGLDPRGYHLTNLLLHAGTAVCIYFLARRLFGIAFVVGEQGVEPARTSVPRVWIDATAAFAALLWSLHPLRVESVAWITERRDCLSGLFFVASLLFWLGYVERTPDSGSRRWYRLAVAFFVASLLSKALGMVLPLVLLALDVWPLRRFAPEEGTHRERRASSRLRELVIEKWPFWIAGALAAVLAVVGQSTTRALVETGSHGLLARCTQAVYGLAFYVRKSVWPGDLMVLDPIPVPFDTAQGRFVAAVIGVVLVAAFVLWRRRRWPAAVVALACYVVLVAPVLGLVQAGSQLVASRYSYLPAIPLSLLAGGMLLLLLRRFLALRGNDAVGPFGVLTLLAGCAALVVLGFMTTRECRTWHDSISLWQHDLAIDPKSGPARRSLIVAWMNQGQRSEDRAERDASFRVALEEVEKGIEQGPDPMYFTHAAKVYSLMAADSPAEAQHDLELALDHARRGVELLERSTLRKPEVYETCGVILLQLDRPAEAVPLFEKMIALDDSSAMRHGLLAGALLQTGRAREAVVQLEAARRIEPDNASVWLELGNAHRANDEKGAAIDAYRHVLAIQQSRLGRSAAQDEEYGLAYQALQELGAGR